MYILGISAFYHDSAACLLKDGSISAAAQEERFTRKKHDPRFPVNAIRFCLDHENIGPNDLDHIVFYDKPFLSFERLLLSYLSVAPYGLKSWLISMPLWLGQKLHVAKIVKRELGYTGEVLFTEHHEAHAASAFYPSPFDEAAFLTIDGVGEWATASYGVGKGKNLSIHKELRFPDSLGLLYSAFTYFAGFRVNSGEYKLMGLAPYGEPIYRDIILSEIVDVKEDGSIRLNMSYFDFLGGLKMTNDRFSSLFGGPPRKPESEITKREMDLAASIQKVAEEIILKMAATVHRETGQNNLCLAGGVALNCVANGKLLGEGPFKNIWIQPAAGDAGGALGAAYSVWHRYLENDRSVVPGCDSQQGSYLGPQYPPEIIKSYFDANGFVYHEFEDGKRERIIAENIAAGKIIGYVCGRMEFGPRALGARSILGDARKAEIQSIMNLKIKFRESFRPFAPSVLRSDVSEYFETESPSPYMLLVSYLKKEKRLPQVHQNAGILERLKTKRSDLPAITHLDYSARIQTVDHKHKPDFFKIIKEFKDLTGCAAIVNTSFNVRGEPIVCNYEDAYRCFMRTEMDVLVVENFILFKNEQPPWKEDRKWKYDLILD